MTILKTFDITSVRDFSSIPLNLFNIPVTKVAAGKRMTILVGKDRVRAYLLVDIVEPKFSITFAEVEAIMAQAGVPMDPVRKPEIEGYIAGLTSGTSLGPVIAAEGRPREDGKDSQVTWHVNFGGESWNEESDPTKVQFQESQQANYRDVKRIVTVEVDQKLCSITPPTKGVPGVDVYGKAIPANDGRAIKFDCGEGVKANIDYTEYTATENGYVLIEDRKLIVSPVMMVAAVDFRTGNIDYKGKVVVNGDVGEGFTVKAGKDLTVGGVAKDCKLTSSGNMAVQALLGNKALAECGGDLTAARIVNSTVRADGRIAVTQEMVNATVHAAGPLSGTEASMVGGELICLGPVHLHSLGRADNATATQSVTIDLYKLRTAKLFELYEKLNALTADIEKIKTGLGPIAENRSIVKTLPAAKQDPINKLLQRLDMLGLQQASFNAEIDKLRIPLEKRLVPEIYIKKVYPGSRVTIRGYTKVFNDKVNDPLKITLPKGASELRIEGWLARSESDLG